MYRVSSHVLRHCILDALPIALSDIFSLINFGFLNISKIEIVIKKKPIDTLHNIEANFRLQSVRMKLVPRQSRDLEIESMKSIMSSTIPDFSRVARTHAYVPKITIANHNLQIYLNIKMKYVKFLLSNYISLILLQVIFKMKIII